MDTGLHAKPSLRVGMAAGSGGGLLPAGRVQATSTQPLTRKQDLCAPPHAPTSGPSNVHQCFLFCKAILCSSSFACSPVFRGCRTASLFGVLTSPLSPSKPCCMFSGRFQVVHRYVTRNAQRGKVKHIINLKKHSFNLILSESLYFGRKATEEGRTV